MNPKTQNTLEDLEKTIEELEDRIKTHQENEKAMRKKISDLEQINTYYSVLMTNTEDGILISDNNGKPLAFNEAYRSKMKELLNLDMKPGIQPHKFINDPNAIAYWDGLLQRVLAGEKFSSEYSHHLDDSLSHFETQFCPVQKNDGIVGFTEITRDITRRKNLEEELKRKTEELETVLDNIPVMIAFIDQHGKIKLINRSFEKTLACPLEKAMHANVWVELYPDPQYRQYVFDFIANSQGDWHEFKTKTLDSRMLNTLWANVALKDGSKIGIGIDITERKHIEETLSRTEKQFQQFFEHLTIGVAVYDAVDDGEDFVISDINPSGQKISQVSLDEIRGKRLSQIFPGVQDLGLFKALQDTWQTGKPCHVPLRQYKDERLTQWVENRVFKLPSGKIVAVYDDRTKLMQLEEGLRQSQKMEAIGTLAGGIAHDFNNMLCVLTGNISYALSILNRNDELYDVLSDVMQGTKQAQTLTTQLLTFAKGGEPIKTTCNVTKLLEESAKFVTSGAKSRCVFKPADDLWTAEIDSGQINQVISNLIINADQAMPDGGSITIQTENIEIKADNSFQLPAGKHIKISIKDQGVGIHEKHIPSIFEPYFTTKQTGSGLGLATAYSIVRRHDGHITVYSELGKGTVFNIYLPASSKIISATEDKEESRHQGQGRILIMDDQESILKMIERMLNQMGYETRTVSDGAGAIELYHEACEAGRPFDLVILDLTVPGGMGGAATIPELLKIDPKVKAIVSSGYSNDPIMANFQDYGFCGVVPKPFTGKHLAELLNQILN